MKNWTKRLIAVLCCIAMVLTSLTISEPQDVKAATNGEEASMITLDGFETVTISDFSKDGIQMPEGTYSDTGGNGTLTSYSLTSGANLDGKLVSMKVKFAGGGGNARFDVGGIGDWSGFSVYASDSANYMHIYTNYGWAGSGQGFDIDASKAGLTSVLDTEFILQMSIKYIEGDTDSVEVGVYINGILCSTCTITGVSAEKFGGYLGVYCQDAGKTITVSSVGEDVTEPEPIELDGFQTLSIEDFGMAAGEYEGASTGGHNEFKIDSLANLDKKLISMKILYEGGQYKHSLIFGGNGGWCGFNLRPSADGNYLYIDSTWAGNLVDTATYSAPTMSAAVAGVPSFINNEFILQISMEYGEADADNKADLTVGIYINGKLYNNEEFVISGCNMNNAGSLIALYREVDGSSIIVNSIYETVPDEPDTPIEPEIPIDSELPDENFEKITFGHFGIVDKTYTYVSGNVAVAGAASGRTTLDKTVICGDILYEGSNGSQIIWGGKSDWNGLRMFPNSAGHMVVSWYEGSTETPVTILDSATAGVAFVGEKYNIMLSSELVDNDADGNVNDIKVGIWFNGVLYDQEYFVVPDMGDKYGNCFSVYCGGETDTVTFSNDMDLLEQPSESLKKVTFLHYGIADGTYESAADINTKGNYSKSDSVAGTVLCGDVQLFNSNVDQIDLFLGSTDNVWTEGVRLVKYGDSSEFRLIYQTPDAYNEVLQITPSAAGVDFTTEKFNLMWSMELVDSDEDGTADDLKVGLWFDGFLYQQAYTYITDFGVDKLGNTFATYCAAGTSIALASEKEELNESFEKLTFGHFGIVDKTYPYVSGNVAVAGTASGRTTLDKTVICGDILYEGSNGSQIIWGGKSDWNGLRMFPNSAGHMAVTWFEGSTETPVTILDSATAGVAFVGEKYNIMLSSELVDNDADGNVNDIKVGIWFNGVLYDQEYFVVPDMGDKYGNCFSVYCGGETDTVTFGSVLDLLEQPSESLKKVTFLHYGVEDGTYESAADINTKGNYSKIDSVAGTVLCGDIQLINSSAGEIDIFLGSTTNVWHEGIRLTKYGDSSEFKLIYQTSDTAYNEVLQITPSVAGVDFTTEKFNLMWSMELVDSDEDGTADDLKVGLWFNGFLYQQAYTYITDFGVDKLGNVFATYCAEGTAIALASVPELAPATENLGDAYYEISNGAYVIDEADEVQIDGATYAKGAEYNTIGVHTMTYEIDDCIYTKYLIIYRKGDTNDSGQMNLKDLMALKKYLAGKRELTKAGKKAADVNLDTQETERDLEVLREMLIQNGGVIIL